MASQRGISLLTITISDFLPHCFHIYVNYHPLMHDLKCLILYSILILRLLNFFSVFSFWTQGTSRSTGKECVGRGSRPAGQLFQHHEAASSQLQQSCSKPYRTRLMPRGRNEDTDQCHHLVFVSQTVVLSTLYSPNLFISPISQATWPKTAAQNSTMHDRCQQPR